ncbi:MAG: hypothetical protein IID32_12580, partial [Planctomycetes bacterium]|nr:hypothetical protein [Planctomycetota bacterium]
VADNIDGTGTWQIDPADNGGNSEVGPGMDGRFDFEANIHSQLPEGGGTQRYVINDVTQSETGDLVINFRYRYSALVVFDDDGILVENYFNPDALTVKVDGVPWNMGSLGKMEGENEPILFPSWISFEDPDQLTVDWWNGRSGDNQLYTFASVVVPNVGAGDHEVSIELTGDGEADLWIDHLSILASQETHAVKPIATLLPTGSDGKRHFGVGITNVSPELRVYMQEPDDEDRDDVFTDGPIRTFGFSLNSFTASLNQGYSSLNIFELETTETMELGEIKNTWSKFGDMLSVTTEVDYLGGIGETFAMPTGELVRLEDLAIGPNSQMWVVVQHATTEEVDTDDEDDIEIDQFDAHPWNIPGASLDRWNIDNTVLDVQVWRWQSALDPSELEEAGWIDTGFSPQQESHAYTNAQLVGSGGQLPTVAWTNRGPRATHFLGGAQRFEADGTWGVLNTESAQNGQGWSGLWVKDLIVREDGFPIIAYHMGHLEADGIREFRPEIAFPDMSVVELSGVANDNQLEFITNSTDSVEEGFSILNAGPGDLLIYDILIGGTGGAGNAFSLVNTPVDFPNSAIVIEPDGGKGIGVRFDPAGVEPGVYTAVLLISSSAIEHPTHPFSHFYEIVLHAEVVNDADIVVDPRLLDFDDTTILETSEPLSIEITNLGTEESQLTISQWLFSGNNYQVVGASRTIALTGDVVPYND